MYTTQMLGCRSALLGRLGRWSRRLSLLPAVCSSRERDCSECTRRGSVSGRVVISPRAGIAARAASEGADANMQAGVQNPNIPEERRCSAAAASTDLPLLILSPQVRLCFAALVPSHRRCGSSHRRGHAFRRSSRRGGGVMDRPRTEPQRVQSEPSLSRRAKRREETQPPTRPTEPAQQGGGDS